MDPTLYQSLSNRDDLLRFIRYNPIWYRYLSRDPDRLNEMEKEAKKFYGKTFPQRVEKIGNNVQMINMLAQFVGLMKD